MLLFRYQLIPSPTYVWFIIHTIKAFMIVWWCSLSLSVWSSVNFSCSKVSQCIQLRSNSIFRGKWIFFIDILSLIRFSGVIGYFYRYLESNSIFRGNWIFFSDIGSLSNNRMSNTVFPLIIAAALIKFS